MYKLRIVAGPNVGAVYDLSPGETSVGRNADNQIVLSSSKISKKHCVLVVDNGTLTIQDHGSANGTFVNGSLIKNKKLKSGDRIGLGEYMLEFTEKSQTRSLSIQRAQKSHFPNMNSNVLPFPAQSNGGRLNTAPAVTAKAAPQDLRGKVVHFFESKIMPFFYQNNQQSEWRGMVVTLTLLFSLASVVISIYPLMSSTQVLVVKESMRRARFIARQISEKNTPHLAAKAETKTEIGPSLENAEGVRVAILTDLESRIIAPGTRFNQYFTKGAEARFAVEARDLFRTGKESGLAKLLDESTVAAVEPVKVFNPTTGQNIVAGMAIVSLDISVTTPNWGEVGVVYSEAFILVGILGLIFSAVICRMTLKPLEVLNEDMDRVLRGDLQAVTRSYRFEELNPLMDIINSALQRASRSNGINFDQGESGPNVDEFVAAIRNTADQSKSGIVICDGARNIVYVNSAFEEITGIRGDSSIGQELSSVARDQAFAIFIQDAFERVVVGSSGMVEDFDISGITYKAATSAFGVPGNMTRSYMMSLTRAEG